MQKIIHIIIYINTFDSNIVHIFIQHKHDCNLFEKKDDLNPQLSNRDV